MDRIRNLIGRLLSLEPALVISTVTGLLLILTNLGLPVAGVDVPMVVETVFNILAIVAGILGIRQSVYSPATHTDEVSDAFRTGYMAAHNASVMAHNASVASAAEEPFDPSP